MIIRVRCYRPCQMLANWHSRVSRKLNRQKQKVQHDKKLRDFTFSLGDRVFVYMPVIRSGSAYKLMKPYKGPFRSIKTHPNGVEFRSVDHSKKLTLLESL